MTDLTTSVSQQQPAEVGTTPLPEPAHSPTAPTTLITEQEVRFSTAAGVALPPARTRGFGDVVRELATKVRAVFARADKPPANRHYPKRYLWIENAAMSREMDRL